MGNLMDKLKSNLNMIDVIVHSNNQIVLYMKGKYSFEEQGEEVNLIFGHNSFCITKTEINEGTLICTEESNYYAFTSANYYIKVKELAMDYQLKKGLLYTQFINLLDNAYVNGEEVMSTVFVDGNELSTNERLEFLMINEKRLSYETESGCLLINTDTIKSITYIPDDEGIATFILQTENSNFEFCFSRSVLTVSQ